MPDVNNFDFIPGAVYETGNTGLFDLPNSKLEFIPGDIFTTGATGLFDLPNERITAIGIVEPIIPTVPVISNVTPAQGTAIAPSQILGFDVTDPEAFRLIMLVADFGSLGIREVVHDGLSFSQNYSGSGNSRVVISNGFQYTILRNGGWPVSPRIIPYAIDVTGEENI